MHWQPIETAPRDGTPILLWAGSLDWRDLGVPSIGWMSNTMNVWCMKSADAHEPTHWMPLPQNPEVSK